jgi:hypothetical protein
MWLVGRIHRIGP